MVSVTIFPNYFKLVTVSQEFVSKYQWSDSENVSDYCHILSWLWCKKCYQQIHWIARGQFGSSNQNSVEIAHKNLNGENAGVIKFCTNKIPDEWKIDGIKTGPSSDTFQVRYHQLEIVFFAFCVEPNFSFLVLIAHFINSLCAALKFVAHNVIPSDDNSAEALLLLCS